MQCKDTDSELPAVRTSRFSTDLVKRIDELLAAIEGCGGNGNITLTVSGGNVIKTGLSTESRFEDTTKRGQRRPKLKVV